MVKVWLLFNLIIHIPVNSFSVMRGCVFLGWTSTKQGFMCLDQGYMQCSQWGSNLQPLHLKSNTLPLSHCAPCNSLVFHWLLTLLVPNLRKKSGHLFSWTMLKNIYTSWKHPCVLYIPLNYCTSLTLSIVRDFPIQIWYGWNFSLYILRGQRLEFPNNVFISRMNVFISLNSEDPDEMQHYAAFHLGLHCLSKYA